MKPITYLSILIFTFLSCQKVEVSPPTPHLETTGFPLVYEGSWKKRALLEHSYTDFPEWDHTSDEMFEGVVRVTVDVKHGDLLKITSDTLFPPYQIVYNEGNNDTLFFNEFRFSELLAGHTKSYEPISNYAFHSRAEIRGDDLDSLMFDSYYGFSFIDYQSEEHELTSVICELKRVE